MTADEEDIFHTFERTKNWMRWRLAFCFVILSGRYVKKACWGTNSAFDYMDVSFKMVFSVLLTVPFLQRTMITDRNTGGI